MSDRPLLVLIEGLDCSGKSTIIAALADRLRDAGYSVREIDGGTLAPDWANRLLLWACRDRRCELLRDLAYRSCVLIDRVSFCPRGPDVIVQHSYVHRQLAYELATSGRLAQAWSWVMARLAVRHDLRILLAVELGERVRRYEQRGFRTERKERRFKTAAGLAHLRCMEAALERLAARADYERIDTTAQSEEETTAAVLALVSRQLARGRDARASPCDAR